MKRHYLLIAGCLLGAVSVGLNIYLYRQRHNPPPKESSEQNEITLAEDGSVISNSGLSKFDFSDTAFADGSWKLTDQSSAVKLDKPFDWEDVNPAQPKVDPDNPFGIPVPLIIKESYAGAPAKIDNGSVKPVQPAPSSPPK